MTELMNSPAIVAMIAHSVGEAARVELDAMRAELDVTLNSCDARALRKLAGHALALMERAAAVLHGAPEAASGIADVADFAPYTVGGIYKAGAIVTLPPTHCEGWALARALADTYDIPGDPDANTWEPLLFHAAPVPGFRFCGPHHPGPYARGDVVLSPGGSLWIRTTPGDSDRVPGTDWALFLKRGATGGRGRAGRDAPRIDALSIEHGQLVVRMTDGSVRACALPAEWLEAMVHITSARVCAANERPS